MDLAAVRLASINQTLDPWLYILLRRSFFVKVCSTLKSVNFKCLKLSERENTDENDRKRDQNNPDINVNNDNSCAMQHVVDHSRVLEQPDVMQSAKNSNSASSPLPDVTNTGKTNNPDSGYVCHLHFGKSEPDENEEGGIYVKIFYLRPESSFKKSIPNIRKSCSSRKCNCVCPDKSAEQRVGNGVANHNNNCITSQTSSRRSDAKSDDTVLSQDYNLTFHSETLSKIANSHDG